MDSKDLHNRFIFHPARGDYEDLRASFLDMAIEIDAVCPDSRELSLAITHLEEALFWSTAAVARNPIVDG